MQHTADLSEFRAMADDNPYVRLALEHMQPDALLTWTEIKDAIDVDCWNDQGVALRVRECCNGGGLTTTKLRRAFLKDGEGEPLHPHLGLEFRTKNVKWPMPLAFRKEVCR